jgi:hypothetical protein
MKIELSSFLILGFLPFAFLLVDPQCSDGTVLCGDRCFNEGNGRADCVNDVCQIKNVTEMSQAMQNLLAAGLITEESIYNEDCSTIVNACGDTFCDLDFEECGEDGLCAVGKYYLDCGDEICQAGLVCESENKQCVSFNDLCNATKEDICDDEAIYISKLNYIEQEKLRSDLCSTICPNENITIDENGTIIDETTSSAFGSSTTNKGTIFGAMIASFALVFL